MSGRTVARVVFDPDGREDRLPLYAAGAIEVVGRRSARIAAGESASFATYFNAFPAWHWQEFTTAREVILSIEVEGSGELTIHRADGEGAVTLVERRKVSGGSPISVPIDLDPNADGGWIWFDLEAEEEGITLRAAEWAVDAEPRETRLASVSITTLDKPEFVLGVLRRIAGDPAARESLDAVLVVDQGTRKVAVHPGFSAVSHALGDRLRIIDQANYGGSGGFARGMIEVLDAERSGSVILLDDDVELEPESIARAVSFAAFTAKPTIVGGHFFDLHRPLRLHAFAERVTPDDFDWGPLGDAPLDFGASPLIGMPSVHRPTRPDYNGWWFCLIPADTLREVGLSLPVFLKWDDAEFGIRAAAAGVPTVSLPGMAVWHISWLDKNDALGWQAFFHARNRMVAALVDERAVGARLPWANLVLDLRYLLTMDYHVVELRHQAIESVLRGPSSLHGELLTRLGGIRETMRGFPSGVTVPMPADPPPSSTGRRPGAAAQLLSFALGVAGHLVARRTTENPEATLSYADSTWWRVMRYRYVLTVNSDGSALQRHVRDPWTFRRMLRRSWGDWRRLRRAWGRLGDQYRAARPGLVDVDAWRATLGLSSPDRTPQPPRAGRGRTSDRGA